MGPCIAWFPIGVLTAAVMLGAPTARAAEVEEPEKLISQGVELRRRGDHARAYGYLKRAYDIARTPRSAAQLGLVEHAVGRFADAEIHLGEALASQDPWVAANRASLESSRSYVRSQLGKVELTGAGPDASVSVGSGAPAKLPADSILWLAPGETTLRIEPSGRSPVTKTVSVKAGESATVAVGGGSDSAEGGAGTAVPAAPRPAGAGATDGTSGPLVVNKTSSPDGAGSEDSGRVLRWTGLGVAGGGLALGVTGFLLRGSATSKMEAIARDAANGDPYNEANDNWRTFDRAGVALMATGAAAVVGGAVLYFLNLPSTESAKVSFAVVPNGGGGMATLGGNFGGRF